MLFTMTIIYEILHLNNKTTNYYKIYKKKIPLLLKILPSRIQHSRYFIIKWLPMQ